MESPRPFRYNRLCNEEKVKILDAAKELGIKKASRLFKVPRVNIQRWICVEIKTCPHWAHLPTLGPLIIFPWKSCSHWAPPYFGWIFLRPWGPNLDLLYGNPVKYFNFYFIKPNYIHVCGCALKILNVIQQQLGTLISMFTVHWILHITLYFNELGHKTFRNQTWPGLAIL